MWKKWLTWLGKAIVQYGPGLVGAILEAKIKKDAGKPSA